MEPNTNPDKEFILRRLTEVMPGEAIAMPVLLALLVLGIIVLLRGEKKLLTLAWGLGIITAISIPYVVLAIFFKTAFSWYVVLVPVLVVALFYVGMMYFADAASIHPLWAGFLGLCRCAVYAILAFVFLLPGCQDFDTTETAPKVLFLFDVSGSMGTKDDLLQKGQKPEDLLSRQDKVIKFLAGKSADKKARATFIERMQDKTPVMAFRFGGVLDTTTNKSFEGKLEGKPAPSTWGVPEWTRFLKPDKKDIVVPAKKSDKKDSEPTAEEKKLAEDEKAKQKAQIEDMYDQLVGATNTPGAALEMMKGEAANYIQAIIIVGDGRSNVGSSEQMLEFLDRVNNRKVKIPVFTVGVGEYRLPASIEIYDLQAPQTARPDDKFPVRVPVVGTELPEEEFTVLLEATRVKDAVGNPIKGEKSIPLPAKKGTFKVERAGDFPEGVVEFEIDLQDLKGIKSADDKDKILEGEWEFIAKVPRHPSESYAKEFHISKPTRVQVQNKELKILLFAGGPNREYQFLRKLLYNEMQEKRVELCVYLQSGPRGEGVDQDVPPERLLTRFPNKMGVDDPTEKFSSLNMFDLIIAIDPDWTALEPATLKNLEKWVGRDAGGIIFVAGPVYSFHLARKSDEFAPLRTILPVVVHDYRLLTVDKGLGIDTTRPYPLNFAKGAAAYDFLKLDPAGESPTAGWDRFFWGENKKGEAGKIPKLGFYNYYPVASLRPDSAVMATFSGPPATHINDGKDEMPYLVSMRYGNGKTVFVGSSETWRLRQFKESFHDRFWLKLGRFAASGSQQQKKYGQIIGPPRAAVGVISMEARLKGADLNPLPRDAAPLMYVKKINDPEAKVESFPLKPKSPTGDWTGGFYGNVKVRDPGEYEITIPIPGTSEPPLSHNVQVYRPNLEEANVRENFKELYQLATDAEPVLNRLSAETRKEVQKHLVSMADSVKDGKETHRLFFRLAGADSIVNCLQKLEPRRERTKGALQDLWDRGGAVALVHLLWSIPLALFLLAGAISMFHEKYTMGLVFFALAVSIPLVVGLIYWAVGPAWMKGSIEYTGFQKSGQWVSAERVNYDGTVAKDPVTEEEFDKVKLDKDSVAEKGSDYVLADNATIRVNRRAIQMKTIDFAFVLISVVGLLAVEWLTRKLLKLA